MRILILADCHHRISSGRSLSFEKGKIASVPRTTAEALIERGTAELIPPRRKGEPNGDR